MTFLDKLEKSAKFFLVSKICVSFECFTTDFSQFSCTTVKIWLLGGRLGAYYQFRDIQGFPNSLIFSHSATREATRTFTFW